MNLSLISFDYIPYHRKQKNKLFSPGQRKQKTSSCHQQEFSGLASEEGGVSSLPGTQDQSLSR
jgi:hypothetical protein